MRIRILSAVACLSLVLLGAGLAQQVGSGAKPKDRPDADPPSADAARKPSPAPVGDGSPEVASLRSRLVQLRAEVELLELEHEADVEHLSALAKDLRSSSDLEDSKGIMNSLVPAVENIKGSKVDPSTLKDQEAELLMNSATVRIVRQVYDKVKKEFLRTATELNEKKLQLNDVEKKYHSMTGK